MNHDVVLILCSFLIYAGLMWSSTRISQAISGFVITIQSGDMQEKPAEPEIAEVKHG